MNRRTKSFIHTYLLASAVLITACEPRGQSQHSKNQKGEGWKAGEVISDINDKASELTKDISEETEEIAKAVSDKVGEILKDSTDSLPAKEVKKLSQFEYKVFEMPVDSANEDFQDELNSLGEERWDCFDVKPITSEEEGNSSFLFFCKRRPFTPLKFVPAGRAIY